MLSTDVSHVLTILSAIYQTPHVFVFRRPDANPCLLESMPSCNSELVRYLKALTFTELCKLGQQSGYRQLDGKVLTETEQTRVGEDMLIQHYQVSVSKHANLCITALHATIEAPDHLPSLFFGAIFNQSESADVERPSAVQYAAQLQTKAIQSVAELLRAQLSVNEEDIYKDIVNLNKDFIYVKNKANEIIFANRAILALFHNPPDGDNIRNQFFQAFEKDIELVASDMKESLNRSGIYELEHGIILPDNTQKLLQTVIRKFDTRSFSDCILFVSRDITEREVLIKDLKRSNYDLDSFAYVASHDLKSPLNVIKRLVSWVMEDCADVLPKDSMEDLGLVMNRANRMEQLLKDLLDYSRIGKDYHQAKTLNVKTKVLELLSLVDLPMGFSVKCDDVDINVPEVPFGIVLLNLIANAIKHHDSGNARIQIKVRKQQTSNVITVIDNGPGIEAENRLRVFELFETLKPRDEIEGSGMGLSVVKRLVEQYGGNIKVEGNRPRGTKFIVHWPLNNMAEQVLTQLGTAKSNKK